MIKLAMGVMGLLVMVAMFVVVSLWEVFDREQAEMDDD